MVVLRVVILPLLYSSTSDDDDDDSDDSTIGTLSNSYIHTQSHTIRSVYIPSYSITYHPITSYILLTSSLCL